MVGGVRKKGMKPRVTCEWDQDQRIKGVAGLKQCAVELACMYIKLNLSWFSQ